MILYDALPLCDKDKIETYIMNHGPNENSSVNTASAPLSHILRFWDANKQDLFDLFGGKFILEKHIEYKQPISDIEKAINKASYNSKMTKFLMAFEQYVSDHFQMWSNEWYMLRDLVNAKTLATNIVKGYVNEKATTITFGDTDITIQQGAKAMRLLAKIAKAIDLSNEFEEFRLEHSLLLNQKKLEGTLCLSIHPLDYITMSDNNCGWTSCMSWLDDGGYRMGTVEMMNSPMVVVAYLRSDNGYFNLGYGSTWNDKRWRSLIIVTKEGVVSVKGYPYQSEDLATMSIQWLTELAKENWDIEFGKITEVPDYSIFEYEGERISIRTETALMYNDFGCAPHYGTFSKRAFENLALMNTCDDKFYLFAPNYSGETECMNCGDHISGSDIYEESYVICDRCCTSSCPTCSCDNCGEAWDEEDMTWVGGYPICPDCLYDVATQCDISGDWFFNEDIESVYLASVKDKPNTWEDKEFNLANPYMSCWSLNKYYFNIEHPRFNEEKSVYYLNKEDVNERGLDFFFGITPDEYFKNKENDI